MVQVHQQKATSSTSNQGRPRHWFSIWRSTSQDNLSEGFEKCLDAADSGEKMGECCENASPNWSIRQSNRQSKSMVSGSQNPWRSFSLDQPTWASQIRFTISMSEWLLAKIYESLIIALIWRHLKTPMWLQGSKIRIQTVNCKGEVGWEALVWKNASMYLWIVLEPHVRGQQAVWNETRWNLLELTLAYQCCCCLTSLTGVVSKCHAHVVVQLAVCEPKSIRADPI